MELLVDENFGWMLPQPFPASYTRWQALPAAPWSAPGSCPCGRIKWRVTRKSVPRKKSTPLEVMLLEREFSRLVLAVVESSKIALEDPNQKTFGALERATSKLEAFVDRLRPSRKKKKLRAS